MDRHLLIVEDDPEARDLYLEFLAGQGFEIETAADGMEALFRAKARRPALVVLDLGLPKLDGVYVAEVWRRDPAMAKVPIIAISAHFDGINDERARKAGCVLTLAKPFSTDELLASIRRLVGVPGRTG